MLETIKRTVSRLLNKPTSIFIRVHQGTAPAGGAEGWGQDCGPVKGLVNLSGPSVFGTDRISLSFCLLLLLALPPDPVQTGLFTVFFH